MLGVRIKKFKNTLKGGLFWNQSKSLLFEKKYKWFLFKMNSDQIPGEFFYNICSRSDQLIWDFLFKFEGDFNFVGNFFLVH